MMEGETAPKSAAAVRPPVSISFEFFPPKSPAGEENLWRAAGRLAALQPAFCSLTYGANGSSQENALRWLGSLQKESKRPVAAHLTCVGASRGAVDDIARGFWDIGIRHIVALRGDAPDATQKFQPHPDGYANAAELVAGLKRIGDFEISVAAYPEIHPDATSSIADLDHLKRKIDAGATRAMTQFFFEPETFLRFADRAQMHGIDVPIIPGILTSPNFPHVIRMARRCGTSIPAWLTHMVEGLEQEPEVRKLVAMTIALEQCRRLYQAGVRDFHFYTLNHADLSQAICHMLGFRAIASTGTPGEIAA